MQARIIVKTALLLSLGLTPVFSYGADQPEVKLSLRQAVELALANNLNLRLQKLEAERTSGASLAAEGKFDSTFNADAGLRSEEQTPLISSSAEQEDTSQWNVGINKLFETGTYANLSWKNNSYDSDSIAMLFNPSYNSGLTLELRQPLLKGFGSEVQTATREAAIKQEKASIYEVDSAAADLAATTKKAYWNLVYAWQNIEVQKLSLTLSKKLLEETETKINVGKLAQVELYQPQSEVARREENLISAERAIGVAEDELKLLVNSDKWLTTYSPIEEPDIRPVQLNLDEIINNALKNRPDLHAADLLVKAAELEVRRTEDDLRPDLSLVGAAGITGTTDKYSDSVQTSFENPDNLWQVAVTFSMPLSNSLAKGQHQQARANLMKAKTSAELLRQSIRKSVRTTIRDVELAIKALDATRKTSFATKKRLEAEQAKFDSGRATTLDVLAAQEAYSQALSQEKLTAISYANSLAELDRIQGLITLSASPIK